ncbi:hypothetical protein AZI86_15525 [Bdellovibrio bacteriovorus]|uniref:Uncharacterized protein n=1 Tax=Bdellovibrio bacteriovorus TaxID=959 RepID=A0A150WHI7_BDEBC|nr:hypothetical protein [Bdellovibrio bacteriovorus]KYG63123.1 hypothetical protein AZI86_15525 [Bdellovibrio bacteriovorus]
MMKPLVFASLIFASVFASAQNRGKPLFFPAEKNNMQILPQRFEYNLMSDSQLRLGDILIDSTKITLNIDHEVKHGYQKAHFSWPAGLIADGEVAIKNNSGIAVFSIKVDQRKLRAQAAASGDDENATRTDMATYTAEIPTTLFEDMKFFPFLKFCIFRETKGTRLYLCSEELVLQKQGQEWNIRPRVSQKNVAQININGKTVGNQGLIYLNNANEDIAFTAEMASGATLEVETRIKAVDFKDITESEDGTRLNLSAAGAEPVNNKRVRRLSDNEWQISLSKARPQVYLKGDGGIPLRQDFDIKGSLPKAKFRPQISSATSPRTYSSTVETTVVAPAGVQVSSSGDTKDTVESLGGNQTKWIMNDLESGASTRHYVKVDAAGNSYLAAYDMYRGLPFFLELSGQYNTPSGLMFGSLELQWWFENFLGINSDATRFHWGLSLERSQHLNENDDFAKVDFNNIEILWRAQEGLHFVDGSWGLSLPIQMIQGDGVSATAYGLGFFWLTPPPTEVLKKLMTWSEFKFNYLFGSSGDDFKLSSAYLVTAKGYLKMSEAFYASYGFTLNGYKYDPAAKKEDPQLGLNLGVAWKF